jgi:hypothetical protein
MTIKKQTAAMRTAPRAAAPRNPARSEMFETEESERTAGSSYTSQERKRSAKTRIAVKYDVGFGNNIFIRGKGANLNWDRGIKLTNVKNDEWVWETDIPFSHCEFKMLINDKVYEAGDNHIIASGSTIQYTPRF